MDKSGPKTFDDSDILDAIKEPLDDSSEASSDDSSGDIFEDAFEDLNASKIWHSAPIGRSPPSTMKQLCKDTKTANVGNVPKCTSNTIVRPFNVSHMPRTQYLKRYHARRCEPGQSTLETLPAELFLMILSELTANEHLPLSLTCKTVASYLKKSDGSNFFDLSGQTGMQYNRSHLLLEKDFPRGILPPRLICFSCKRYCTRKLFADNQWRKNYKHRCCVTCAIYHKVPGYMPGRPGPSIAIKGLDHFACIGCLEICRVDDQALKSQVRQYLPQLLSLCDWGFLDSRIQQYITLLSSQHTPSYCKHCLPIGLQPLHSIQRARRLFSFFSTPPPSRFARKDRGTEFLARKGNYVYCEILRYLRQSEQRYLRRIDHEQVEAGSTFEVKVPISGGDKSE